MTTILEDLETKLGVADTSLDLLVGAANDPAGTFRVADGTDVPNLRARLEAVGYLPPVAFGTGQSVTTPTFTVTYLDNLYAAKPSEVPFTTNGTFDPTEWVLLQRMDEFETVPDLIASLDSARGVGVEWRADGYRYQELDPSAIDQDITTAGGVKLKYQPQGEVYPQAIADVGDLTTLPATDEKAALQKAVDIAVREGVPLHLRGFRYRCEGTLKLTGLAVLRGSGFQIYFPPSATYDLFKQSDGTTDVTGDSTVIALDVSGGFIKFEGDGNFRGEFLSSFQISERAKINPNLCLLGGKTAQCAALVWSGNFSIEGFAYPVYVPNLGTTGDTRSFARFVGGWILSRYNLTTVGYFGDATNPTDEWSVLWDTRRCGGYGPIYNDQFKKSHIHFKDLFYFGLSEVFGNSDAEPSTATINGTTTIVLDDDVPELAAGDEIVIYEGFSRATDSALRPLNVYVVSATTGGGTTTITTRAETAPNRSASGLKWYYRPPLWRLDNCHIHCSHAYFEGYGGFVRINDFAGMTIDNWKLGGTKCSGRQGAPINCVGLTSSFRATCQNECFETTQIDYLVNYGMIREISSGLNAGFSCQLRVFYRDDESYNVGAVQGIDPAQGWYFQTGRNTVPTAEIGDVDVTVSYTNGLAHFVFEGSGGMVVNDARSGRYRNGNVYLTSNSRLGTPPRTVECNNATATTLVSVGSGFTDLAVGQRYTISAQAGNLTWVEADVSFIVVDATTILFQDGYAVGSKVTFSSSGGSLQAQLTSAPTPQDVRFTLLPRM
jgi:hypothetical protein